MGENSIILFESTPYAPDVSQEILLGDVGSAYLNYSNTDPYDGLVAYYPFDSDVNDTQLTTAYDTHLNDNHGTLQYNATIFSGVDGECLFGKCLNLTDGDTIGGVLIPATTENSAFGTGDFTYMIWAKIYTSSGADRNVLWDSESTGGTSTNNGGTYMLYQTTSLTFGVEDNESTSNGNVGIVPSTKDDGLWHHYVGVRNSTGLAIYIDGTLSGSNGNGVGLNVTTNPAVSGIGIGGRGDEKFPTSFEPNMTVDEFMIFNKQLTGTQISNIYNNQSAKFKNYGNMTFQSIDLTTSTTANVSVPEYIDYVGNYVQVSLDDGGNWTNFTKEGISGIAYNVPISPVDNANLTLQFITDSNNAYSPTISGTITIHENLENADKVNPNITFGTNTRANNSYQLYQNIYINLSTEDTSDHYSFVDFGNDLALWLTMDDRNSSGDPTDLSIYSNNGTFSGDSFIDTYGYFGDGAQYDGTTDYLKINADSSLNFDDMGNYTWAGWFKSPSIDLGNFLSEYEFGTGGFVIGSFGGSSLNIYDDSIGLEVTGPALVSNQWYHFVIVYNTENNITLYVNGELNVTDTSNTFNDFAGDVYVGGNDYFNLYTQTGTTDEVMWFNRVLGADEISALYNASANQYIHNFTNLAEGTYNFTGYAVDIEGNRNQTEQRFINIVSDTTGPNLTINSPTQNQILVETGNILFNLTAVEPESSIDTYLYSIDGNANVSFDGSEIITNQLHGNHSVTFCVNNSIGLFTCDSRNYQRITVSGSSGVSSGIGEFETEKIDLYNFSINATDWRYEERVKLSIYPINLEGNATDVNEVLVEPITNFNVSFQSDVYRLKEGEYYIEYILPDQDYDSLDFNITLTQNNQTISQTFNIPIEQRTFFEKIKSRLLNGWNNFVDYSSLNWWFIPVILGVFAFGFLMILLLPRIKEEKKE